jgi:NADPH-dependent 2,4-dienoyl-CoA reductase/sulfur reductase-like enzyme
MRCALILAIAPACDFGAKPVGDAPPTASYDVVVVGAGTGGTSAAIAAAKHGASVLLVEPTGWVGGQMASVPSMATTAGWRSRSSR